MVPGGYSHCVIGACPAADTGPLQAMHSHMPAASVLRVEIVAIAGMSPGSSWCARYPAAVVIRYD